MLSVCLCQLSLGVSLDRLFIHDLCGPCPSSFISETPFCPLATLVVTDFFHACPNQNFSCCHTSKHTHMPPWPLLSGQCPQKTENSFYDRFFKFWLPSASEWQSQPVNPGNLKPVPLTLLLSSLLLFIFLYNSFNYLCIFCFSYYIF